MLKRKKKWTHALLALSLCFSLNAGFVQAESISQAAEDLITQYPDLVAKWRNVPGMPVSDSEIKSFVNAISSKVEQSGGVTEENIGAKFNQALDEVLASGEHTKVIVAAGLAFGVDPTTRKIPTQLQPLKEVIKSDLLSKVEASKPTEQPPTSGGGGGGGSAISPKSVLAEFKITASLGGKITFGDSTLFIPAGAVSDDVTVTIKKVDDHSSLMKDSKFKLLSDVFEITKDIAGNFSKPVTVTLSFTTSQLDVQKYDIGVYWYNDDQNTWVLLDNQTLDFKAGKISGEVTHFTKFAVLAVEKEQKADSPEVKITDQATQELQDIHGHWAEAQIKELVQKGAINGYPDHMFKPNASITRAEFAAVLTKAFQLENRESRVFADTRDHWAKDAIGVAAAQGIVSGYDAEHFGPNDPITREQLAVMIVKAAKLDKPTSEKEFADQSSISAWAKESIAAAIEKGIINGYPDNTFKAKGNATRAEAVAVIVKAMK